MDELNIGKTQAILELLYADGDHAALRRYTEDQAVHRAVREYAAGLLMRPWLPWGARRQALMFVLTIGVIALSLAFASLLLLLLLVIPVCFSPRVVGEALAFIARFRQGT